MKKFLFIAALIVSNSVFAADITESCEKYISEFSGLITEASGNAAAKAQADIMNTQLEQTKTQLASLPEAQQDAICKQGMDSLPQIKAAMGLK